MSDIAGLESWKRNYGGDASALEVLLRDFEPPAGCGAQDLIRLHETLLFLRAYPHSAASARLADGLLSRFHRFTAELAARDGNLYAFEEPEVSGIAGTEFTAVFSYHFARRLTRRHPHHIDIDWERFDTSDQMGPVLRALVPFAAEDWPVEAHVPFEDWMRAARGRQGNAAAWLLDRVDNAEFYDRMQAPLKWRLAATGASRTRARLGPGRPFVHNAPLIARRDVALAAEFAAPPIPVTRLKRDDAAKALDAIIDASAVRYRELYGFSHPDQADVQCADFGRGLRFYFFGVPAAMRLPLRAYHAGMFFKNGVPVGYVETLSVAARAEIGFNLYYTFREGETAWLYARMLKLFHQQWGIRTFSVDPYQIGHENEEAIESGAYWFYRKLGFRSTDRAIAALTAKEEARIAARPGYRTAPSTLRRMAAAPVVYECDGARKGEWDGFHIRNIGMRVAAALGRDFGGDAARMRQHAVNRLEALCGVAPRPELATALSLIDGIGEWSPAERSALARVLRAKSGASESAYPRAVERHQALRRGLVRLGQSPLAAD